MLKHPAILILVAGLSSTTGWTADSRAQAVPKAKAHVQGIQSAPSPAPTAVEKSKQAGVAGPADGNSAGEERAHSVKLTTLPPVTIADKPKSPLDHVFDWGPWAFNFGLLLVGAGQVWLLWETWKKIGRQADLMETQSGHMAGQLEQMAKQTEALVKSVAAAELSARAANDNIELVIQKERARLRVKVYRLNMNSGGSAPVSWTVRHYGATEAFIVQTGARMTVTGDPERPEWPTWMPSMVLFPEVMTADTPPQTIQGTLLHAFSEHERELVENGKAFVYLFGFIEYKDRFDRRHESKFSLKWTCTDFPNLGRNGKYFFWDKCGPETDNVET